MGERRGNRDRERKPARRFSSDSRGSSGRSGGRSGGFRRDSGDSPRRFGRPERFSRDDRRPGRLEMHRVICDTCGEECEVPFKPTSSKPVYCSDCFRKQEGSSSRSSPRRSDSSGDLAVINQKLDKIMQALKIR